MADVPGRLQHGTSFDQAMPMINNVLDSLDSENRTKIIRNGTTPTLLMGYQKAGFGAKDYGLKVAMDGVDVTTATDDQLAFSSAFDTLKVVQTGNITLFKAPSTVSANVAVTHNLGYAPYVLATIGGGSYGASFMRTKVNTTSGIVDQTTDWQSNSTDVTFFITTPSAGADYAFGIFVDIKYYFLRETAI